MTNHDELCEKDWNKYGLPDCPICGKMVALICPDDLKKLQDKAKLSGSCEGMTVEEIFKIVFNTADCHISCPSDKTGKSIWLEIAEAIHAQMTGGGK